MKNNISLTGQVWKIPIHKQKIFLNFAKGKLFENSENFSKFHICPPNYPELKLKEVDHICSVLKKI